MEDKPCFGGCQCGAIRYSVASFGRASICHCRMCQRALGNVCAPLVTALGLTWLCGEPKRFRSSNKVQRGFCERCGTPLTYEPDDHPPELAIATLDHPSSVEPAIQVGLESRLPWFDRLTSLPTRTATEAQAVSAFFAGLTTFQYKPTAEVEGE